MSAAAGIKSVLFVVTTLSIALAILLGAGGCHRAHGPVMVRGGPDALSAAPPPSPLEGAAAKGDPTLARQAAPPPAVGGVPRTDELPVERPYRHDGARIERSVTTGVPGTDPRR